MSEPVEMPGPGTVYPRQPSPETTNRRVQQSFAMKMPVSPTAPQDACYEGISPNL